MFHSTQNTPSLVLEGPLFSVPGLHDARQATVRRLLLPIDATERSRQSLAYVKAQHQQGVRLEICLLYIGEPVKDLEVLRFRTRAEMAAFHKERAQYLLADAAQSLQALGIAHQAFFCVGEIPDAIRFAAAQAGCAAIVLPEPHPAWQRFFRQDNVRAVLAGSAHVPVIIVDAAGHEIDTNLALAA